ncbi:hypothetical protein CY34DRAFT_19548 [Suillus luteus UH-Slu-Lm8-n1]|uniref:Uncharacterized protein n=1 Tax=Suillus luteus UH-Slu-Lm8-n1 TaxID=930992 RepID=A0A0C9ZR54_9AGAM|nr:hypothetical protein CY34DRAFT_19548 [Suillus luteus UH-Slu-Lm8-n1]
MRSSYIVSPSLSPTPARDSVVTAPNNDSAIESHHMSGSSACAASTSPPPFEHPCSCARSASILQHIISTNITTGETTQSEGHSRHSGHGIEKADGATPSGRASRFENAAEERKKAEEDEVLQVKFLPESVMPFTHLFLQPRIEGQT